MLFLRFRSRNVVFFAFATSPFDAMFFRKDIAFSSSIFIILLRSLSEMLVLVSSAYVVAMAYLSQSEKFATKIMKSRGDSIHPWGTSEFSFDKIERHSSIFTLWVLFVKKELNQYKQLILTSCILLSN